MTDLDVKIVALAYTVVAGIVGAVISVILFFWRESRDRLISRRVGMRMMLIISQLLLTSIRTSASDVKGINYDWMIPYLDMLMRDDDLSNMVVILFEVKYALEGKKSNGSEYIVSLEDVKRRIKDMLSRQKIRRVIFFC